MDKVLSLKFAVSGEVHVLMIPTLSVRKKGNSPA